jgi:phosphohistidine phosphatase
MTTFEVYLVRHGLAGEPGSYTPDEVRPLTAEGEKKTRQVAKHLRHLNLKFDHILTSPLVRAKQTAEILLDVGLGKHLESADFLAPRGNIHDWVTWLQTWERSPQSSLALVGHEPCLSQWAETLIWGQFKGAITLKKAGIIGLSLPLEGSPIGHSCLFWLTPPRLLG